MTTENPPTPDPVADEGTPPGSEAGTDGADLEPLPEDESVDLRTVKERNRELATLRSRIHEMESEREEARQAQLSEQEKAIEEARTAGYNEAESKYQSQLLEARIQRLAVGAFAEPSDVTRFLDLSDLDPAIKDADVEDLLTKLLEAKPYLGAGDNGGQKPRIPQGPRGPGADKPNDDWLGGLIRQ